MSVQPRYNCALELSRRRLLSFRDLSGKCGGMAVELEDVVAGNREEIAAQIVIQMGSELSTYRGLPLAEVRRRVDILIDTLS